MPIHATPTEIADYLTDGYYDQSGEKPHWFDVTSGPITVDLSGLNASGRQLARWAIEAWESVADVDFAITSGGGMLKFEDGGSGATSRYAYLPSGELTSAVINIDAGWIGRYGDGVDSYTFRTYMHEIGHVLGLGHPGAYNTSADYARDANFTTDSWQTTVMSYFSQTENTDVTAGNAVSVTAMQADILAIQSIYGAATDGPASGDTVWGIGSEMRGWLGEMFRAMTSGGDAYQGDPFTLTVYDPNGEDTIDFSHDSAAQRVDLAPGAISDVNRRVGSMIIDESTWIENYVAGSANDWVRGSEIGNRIEGRDGADELIGMNGADELYGGAGQDTLTGNNGADRIYGGADNDRIIGAVGNDKLWGGEGADTILGLGGHDTAYGESGDDRLEGGGGNDWLDGGDGSDTLLGGNRDDSLFGGADNDGLLGHAGNDSLFGGSGSDRLEGGGGEDLLEGGDDGDTLLGGNRDDRLYGGAGNDHVSGHAGHDSLYGGAGNDILIGMGGRDWIEGGSGDDVLTGGGAADTFVYDGGRDRITDFREGIDQLVLDDALWGNRAFGTAEILDMARVNAAGVVFDFGEDKLILEGLTRLDGLGDLHIV